jgi:hypothetical protein
MNRSDVFHQAAQLAWQRSASYPFGMPRCVVVWLLLATSCSSEGTSDGAQPVSQDHQCFSGVDDLLRESGALVEAREDCGSFGGFDPDLVAAGYECLESAIHDGRPAELTVNLCVDCSILSTFVSTSDGDLLRLEMEDDNFGDELRTATVERCTEIGTDSNELPRCMEPTQLYRCQAPRN